MFKSFNKQPFNGAIGEARTKAILVNKFNVFEGSFDIEGRDFSVEIIQDSLEEQRIVRKAVNVLGIVQSKFFEGKNQVKIASDYVTDAEGARTDFFAIIHTDDENLVKHSYFFTASQIKKAFRLKTEKDGKSYYMFKLAKNRTYDEFRDIPDYQINDVIEQEILRTKEYRNQEFIQSILNATLQETSRVESDNNDFFESLSGKHLVDKLHFALKYYSDFKAMLAWRVIEKINFRDHINDNTYYHHFRLVTNDKVLTNFFTSLEISDTVKIKSKSFFKGVAAPQKKVNEIIAKLRNCNVNELELRNKKVNIQNQNTQVCICPVCNFERLKFHEVDIFGRKKIKHQDGWTLLSRGFILFSLGKFEEAIPIIKESIETSRDSKEAIPEFIAKYNLEILYRYTASYDKVLLSNEALKLKLNDDKKLILKSVAERTLLNDYKSGIDKNYLQVKEFKARTNNNSTFGIINSMRISLIECRQFYSRNRFFITEEFDILFDKYIEACILSYSMQVDYRQHIACLDDFDVKIMVLYCDSDKLLAAFQRNKISSIKYNPADATYFTSSVQNFFSDDNIKFIKKEIVYRKGKTKNFDLRKRTQQIFRNIFIVLTYVEVEKVQNLLPSILNFIKEFDYKPNDLSMLAHPILTDTAGFNEAELLQMANLLRTKKDSQSYLLTNCLWGLHGKGFHFDKSHSQLQSYISTMAIKNPEFHLLRPLKKVLHDEDVTELIGKIEKSLIVNFNIDLYYEAVVNNLYTDNTKIQNKYLDLLNSTIDKQYLTFMDNCNPYTGINNHKQEKLDEFIEVVYTQGKDRFPKNIMEKASSMHEYYKFLLNLETYEQDQPFELLWLLINDSNIIYLELGKYANVRMKITELITSTSDNRILKAYAKFSNLQLKNI